MQGKENKKLRVCAYSECSNSFDPKGTVRIYCSERCQRKKFGKWQQRKRASNKTKICANSKCFNSFNAKGSRRIYCSDKCSDEVTREKARKFRDKKNEMLYCINKSIPFKFNSHTEVVFDEVGSVKIIRNIITKKEATYPTRKKFYTFYYKALKINQDDLMKRICRTCKKIFIAKTDRHRYCSDDCVNAVKGRNASRERKNCAKKRKQSKLVVCSNDSCNKMYQKHSETQKYCSEKCGRQANRKRDADRKKELRSKLVKHEYKCLNKLCEKTFIKTSSLDQKYCSNRCKINVNDPFKPDRDRKFPPAPKIYYNYNLFD